MYTTGVYIGDRYCKADSRQLVFLLILPLVKQQDYGQKVRVSLRK